MNFKVETKFKEDHWMTRVNKTVTLYWPKVKPCHFILVKISRRFTSVDETETYS